VVERMTVQVTFATTFLSDVAMYLISPDGTFSELIRSNAGGAGFNGSWTFETQAFRGEDLSGTWTVRIVDQAGADILTVSDIVITGYGASTTDDRYIFTNEYSDYAGVGGHLTAINDSNGGTDTVNAAAVSSGSDIRLDGGSGVIDGVSVSFSGMENAIGGDGADTITGNGANNQLFGLRGADAIYGGSGTDTLTGGTGNDTMVGGADNDIYLTDGSDTITELVGDGIDWVKSQVSIVLAANVEYLDLLGGFSALNGTGNDLDNRIRGNASDNKIVGGAGNDTLIGGAGNDTLIGGAGNDTISGGNDADSLVGGAGNDVYFTDGLDTITEVASGGIDTVQSAVSFALLGINLENLTLLDGFSALNGTGNGLNNIITGNSAGNNMNGGAGDDKLNGGGGNDTLIGGTGADTLSGGANDDTYFIDGLDVISEAATGGLDTVKTLVSYTMGANLENLVLLSGGTALNGTGNGLGNVILGNSADNNLNGGGGNDRLLGGAGADTLIGGAGSDSLLGGANNDTYFTDGLDVITENVTGGVDTVKSSGSYTMAANLEHLVLLDIGGAINGSGNGQSNTIEGNIASNILTGGAGNDSIAGGGGDDTLNGGADVDFLNGGLGADQMNGGTGADAFVFTSALGAGNIDTIVGFSVADDTIRLENAVFTGLVAGGLVAAAFKANLSGLATDASDRIIYETDTGFLYFDSDGTGAASRVQFASLVVGLGLTNLDFTVI
jgi:Ca2+-binding RTX toxin-like protein